MGKRERKVVEVFELDRASVCEYRKMRTTEVNDVEELTERLVG